MRTLLSILAVLTVTFTLAEAHAGRVVCYYSAWAVYRSGVGRYGVKDIPVDKCTHVIYSFAGIDAKTHKISILDQKLEVTQGDFKKFTSLKSKHPKVKFMISVGGWAEGGAKFSAMVSKKTTRNTFIQSVVQFMKQYNFDGLDLEWEYPGNRDRNGKPADKDNFLYLVQELKAAFGKVGKKWEVTAAVPVTAYNVVDGYHVPQLCAALDAVHTLTFDLRGVWNGQADVHSPLRGRYDDLHNNLKINVVDGLELWEDKGCPANKLVVGIPFYGRTFTLNKGTTSFLPGAPINTTIGGGEPGKYTGDRGSLAYYEICTTVDAKRSKWTKKWAEYGMCPYAYYKLQWVGYENPKSIEIKMNWLKRKGYLGAMTWALDLDDFRGLCGEKNPLLNVLYKHMSKYNVLNTK